MENKIVNRYFPDKVSAPGGDLEETIEALGISVAELALRTGQTKKTITEIIRGKAAITPDIATAFERELGVTAGFWLRREQSYRESLEQQRAKAAAKAKLSS